MTYASIVFMQSPEADSPAALWLENAWQGDDDSLVDYLSQWDDGEYHDTTDSPPWGTSDDTFTHGEYIVTYNRALGYVGLCIKLES